MVAPFFVCSHLQPYTSVLTIRLLMVLPMPAIPYILLYSFRHRCIYLAYSLYQFYQSYYCPFLKRAKEIGIRKVIGGRQEATHHSVPRRIIYLMLDCVYTGNRHWCNSSLPLFNQLSNKALALSYLFRCKLMAGYIVLFIITGLLAGFYPALVFSGYNPVQTLYSRFISAVKIIYSKSLVVLQFALASFLIIATFTIFSQFNYLTIQKLGYDDNNLVIVDQLAMKRR